eukprot:Rhum_TRINITY_DN16776_c0_g1::Rhum_TRINITY_DN16776_c0_g1_i1::g.164378::m.164378/K17917/SNX1_2; sorting nexin-1/2
MSVEEDKQVAPLAAGVHYEFVVADPAKREKQGALEMSYWTYQVLTRTDLPEFKNTSMKAVRRYSDFAWLRDTLVEEFPGVICPPIPEKSLKGNLEKVSGTGPSPLRDYRQRAMRKFLVRVGAHRVLHNAQPFVSFLEIEDEAEFQRLTKEPRRKVEVELGTVDKAVQMKNSMMGTKSKAPQETAWEEARQYVAQLEGSLIMLRDRVELLVKRRRDAGGSLNEFGKAFAKVGEIERSYEGGPLSTALVDVGQHSEHLALIYGQQAETETVQVTETIGYYIGLCQAVRDVIKRLQRISLTRDLLEQGLASLNDEKAKKPQKAAAIEKDIAVTTTKLEEAENLLKLASETFEDELKRFHREKQYDIKQLLRSFVELQLEYANKMRKSWETMLPSVEAIKTE